MSHKASTDKTQVQLSLQTTNQGFFQAQQWINNPQSGLTQMPNMSVIRSSSKLFS